jgi:hypothetical protein
MVKVTSLPELFAQCRAAGVAYVKVTADSIEATFGPEVQSGRPAPAIPETGPVNGIDAAMNAPDLVPAVEREK